MAKSPQYEAVVDTGEQDWVYEFNLPAANEEMLLQLNEVLETSAAKKEFVSKHAGS